MRLAFAGTPAFAAEALAAVHAAGHHITLVLTRPDKPAGRGLRVAESDVARRAAILGLEVCKPPSLRDAGIVERLRMATLDAMVVAAYGLILPQEVLAIPRHGCLNIHASLLPRWRGAAPIQRAILAGDTTTGVSIMQMDAGLDTGAVMLQFPQPIGERDTSGSLTEMLARRGADAIVQALGDLDSLRRTPQDDSQATYAAKITRADARIDWGASCVQVDRQIRALNPAPGAETTLDGSLLKIWSARPVSGSGSPGEILSAPAGDLVVACGSGAIRLDSLQRAGGRPMPADAFLRGARVGPGTRFGSPAPVA